MQESQKNTLNETIDTVIEYLKDGGGIHKELSGLLGTLKSEQSKLSIDKTVNIQEVLDCLKLVFDENHQYYKKLQPILQRMLSRETSQKEKAQLNFRNAIEYLRKLSPEDLKSIEKYCHQKFQQVKPDESNDTYIHMYIQSLITKVKNTKEENPVQTIELENNRITIAIYYSLTQN